MRCTRPEVSLILFTDVSRYAPKSRLDKAQKQTFLESCLLELRDWSYDLPPEMRILHKSRVPRAPQVYTLHMVYHIAHILLVKPYSNLDNKKQAQPKASQTQSTNIDADALCYQAASDICTILQTYRKTFGSFRQSPVTATHCTLSAVLILLRQSPKDREKVANKDRAHIKTCLQTLQELSCSWNPAGRIHKNVERICSQIFHGVNDQASSPKPVKDPDAYEDRRSKDGGEPVQDSSDERCSREHNPTPSTFSFLWDDYGLESLGVDRNLGLDFLDPSDDMMPGISSDAAFANELLPSDYESFDLLKNAHWNNIW